MGLSLYTVFLSFGGEVGFSPLFQANTKTSFSPGLPLAQTQGKELGLSLSTVFLPFGEEVGFSPLSDP